MERMGKGSRRHGNSVLVIEKSVTIIIIVIMIIIKMRKTDSTVIPSQVRIGIVP